MNWAFIPNVLTVARIAMAPPLALAILGGRPLLALGLALACGFSDLLDGWLARRYRWETRIGALLDPVADKLLMLAAVIPLGVVGVLPIWLVLLVVIRDLVIVAGATAWHHFIAPLMGQPTRLSKITTAAQIVLVLVALVELIESVRLPDLVWTSMVLVVAGLTLASGLHYVVAWGIKARAMQRHRT